MSGILKNIAVKLAAPISYVIKLFREISEDIESAIQIVPGCWTLYLIMIFLGIANLFIFFNGLSHNEIFIRLIKYTLVSVIAFLLILLIVKIFQDPEKHKKVGEDVARFYVFYWTISRISLLVDGLMIGMIKRFGIWNELLLIIPLFFIICLWNIRIYDKFLEKGVDLFKEEAVKKGKLRKAVMKNRKTIFWFGSIILEPDIVTIFLRKRRSAIKNLSITLPSTIVCISVWSAIFWLGLQGYKLFKWFIE